MKKILFLLLLAMPVILKAQTKDTFTVLHFSIKNIDTGYSDVQHKGGGLSHLEVASKNIKPIPTGTKIVITMPEYYKGWFTIYNGHRYYFIRKEITTK